MSDSRVSRLPTLLDHHVPFDSSLILDGLRRPETWLRNNGRAVPPLLHTVYGNSNTLD
jgi:hypothetical protein